MSKRVFSNPSWTPVAVGDGASMTANGAGFLQGASATQRTRIHEICMTGMAGSSAPSLMEFGRDSIIAVTSITLGTNGKDAPQGAAVAALAAPVVTGFSATTMPQRSATLGGLKMCGFNAFGGIFKWQTKDDDIIDMIGNTQPLGELSLSAFTGGTPGLLQSEVVYETD